MCFQFQKKSLVKLTETLCLLVIFGVLLVSCSSGSNAQEQTKSEYGTPTTNTDPGTSTQVSNPTRDIDNAKATKSTVAGDIQYVTSSLTPTRYEPILVHEGIPVQWTLEVPEDLLDEVNSELVIPEYEIAIKLHVGENLIVFTPAKAGTFEFASSTNTMSSYIAVADKEGNIPPKVTTLDDFTCLDSYRLWISQACVDPVYVK